MSYWIRILTINCMKKHFVNKFLIALGAFILVSCFEDPGTDIVWGNKAYLELDLAGQPNPSEQLLFERKNDGTTYDVAVQVNIMGRPQKSATTVNFVIDPASTAIEGVHYNMITAGGSISIPAGENIGEIEYEVLADNIEAGEEWTLIFTLAESSSLPLSNYAELTYEIGITCPSDLAGLYDGHTDWIDYYGTPGSDDYEVDLAVGSASNIYVLPDLSGGMEPIIWSNPPVLVNIVDVCDEILLGSYTYLYGYAINAGAVNPGTGVITIDWENIFGENGDTTLTPQ